jgi:methionyl-tRNA synthetase
MSRYYVTTADAQSALEAVQADVLARHHRIRGDRVWFLTAGQGHREPLTLFSSDVLTAETDTRLREACKHDIYREADTEYFRLSRHTKQLRELISSGQLRIEPARYRDLLEDDSEDVPIEGWWDKLASYINSIGYGTDGPNYRRWWVDNDHRVHVVGEDALRLHAVLWPAMLLSAGLPLPTDIRVHDSVISDIAPAQRYGTDAVRWWLLHGGTTVDQLVHRANKDLANGLGKLVDRIVVMVHRYRDGRPPAAEPAPSDLLTACRTVPERVHEALDAHDFERATAAVWRIVDEAHRYLGQAKPWELARAENAGEELDAALAVLLVACRTLANQLTPFMPTLATRIAEQCFSLSGTLAPAQALFPRLRQAHQAKSA